MTYTALCNCTLLIDGESKAIKINETVSGLDEIEAALAISIGFIKANETEVKESKKTTKSE